MIIYQRLDNPRHNRDGWKYQCNQFLAILIIWQAKNRLLPPPTPSLTGFVSNRILYLKATRLTVMKVLRHNPKTNQVGHLWKKQTFYLNHFYSSAIWKKIVIQYTDLSISYRIRLLLIEAVCFLKWLIPEPYAALGETRSFVLLVTLSEYQIPPEGC